MRLRYRPERLGRCGVCSFCGYIGPPLLCGCVTEMRKALTSLLRGHLGAEEVLEADAVLDRQNERIRILNDALRAERV